MPDFNPTQYAVPLFVVAVLAEMIWAKFRAPEAYEPKDTLVSLSFGLGSTVAGALLGGFALWLMFLGNLTIGILFTLPVVLLGFHPVMIAICGGFNLIYQFWIHTEAIKRMPAWFEAVMNTPSHHRVHHATNPRYLDRNYAGVFIVWDRLFGTFEAEVDDEPIRYGIVKQLGSFNLLWSVFHEWIGMLTDIWRAPWKHKLSYLLREPGWSHNGSRETSDMIRAKWQARVAGDVAPVATSVATRNRIAASDEAA